MTPAIFCWSGGKDSALCLYKVLQEKKLYDKESYEEVIWDLIEDTMELSEETKNNIELSRKQIKEGKVYTLEEVKKKLDL